MTTATAPTELPSLTVAEVVASFARIAAARGMGSALARRGELAALFARATAAEQEFLARLASGELRQGGLEGVMIEAVAEAAGVPAALLRRAAMLGGDLPGAAELALDGGAAALATVRATVAAPIAPMLASPSEGLDEALAELGGESRAPVLVEWKLDGARVQVHRSGDAVRVFTRALLDVTAQVPEVVEVARALPATRLILDGETIALTPSGAPRPFQETQGRFATRRAVAEARASLPLSVFFFDLLLRGDTLLIDEPLARRRAALLALVPPAHRIPAIETSDPIAARAFLDDAIARGHEGVMVKSLASPWQAGARGRAWQKVKRAHTLDLVVLAAEWGSGRRRGWLSNLHLGARDGDGGFVMLGKTFKGMSDATLRFQTEALLARQTRREGHVVHVRPELVVEVAFDGVQRSAVYPGGVALRFARVMRYRDDKTAEQADELAAVLALAPPDARGPEVA